MIPNLFSQLSRRSGCTRILGHPEVVEDQPHPAVEVSHLLRDIGDAFGFDEPDREPSEPRDIFGPMLRADTAAVFIEVPVKNIVATILDAPMAPIDGEDLLGRGLVWCTTRDTIGELKGAYPRCLLDPLTFDDEGLPDVGEFQVGIEGLRGPNLSGLDPPVAEGCGFDEIRGTALFKVTDDVLEQSGLVAFHGEVVVGLPVVDQIRGERALGQEGIGGDRFAVNLDGLEQRSGHGDLVGLLALVGAFYGQGPDFFWV